MSNPLDDYKPIEYRPPSSKALVSALAGAIVILTPDGHNVVVTPEVARIIGREMDDLAQFAETFKEPPEIKKPLAMPLVNYGKANRMCPN